MKTKRTGGVLCGLGIALLVAWGTWWAHGPVDHEVRSGEASASWSVALLGGFRGLAADLLWVQAYRDWSRRDAVALRERLQWVGRVDPEPLTFWLNGTRMLAYDVTAWRMQDDGDAAGAALDAERIAREQAEMALDFLAQGQRVHGACSAVWIEEAVVRLRLLEDRNGALAALARADACADAPYFVGRLRGELLVELGRRAEALTWLRSLRDRLPTDDEEAMRSVVEQRVRRLEAELGGSGPG